MHLPLAQKTCLSTWKDEKEKSPIRYFSFLVWSILSLNTYFHPIQKIYSLSRAIQNKMEPRFYPELGIVTPALIQSLAGSVCPYFSKH